MTSIEQEEYKTYVVSATIGFLTEARNIEEAREEAYTTIRYSSLDFAEIDDLTIEEGDN